jgi:hypothetical protein
MVIASVAWPSSSGSSFRLTPRMTAQDASVWRSVWKLTSSSFAASTALSYAVLMNRV